MKKNIVFGFLGTTLDGGLSEKRWLRWRPTVSLCAQSTFTVDRLELVLLQDHDIALAEQIRNDIARISPTTQVVFHSLQMSDPWDLPQTYTGLHDLARSYSFQEDDNYFVHLTTGTHIAQICLFLLTESRYFPAKLLNTQPDKTQNELWRGQVRITDLDVSQYDLLASRFQKERHDSETLLKSGIATKNVAFNRLIGQIEKVCIRSTAPMLLTGPTGAGKSQLAKRIYELRKTRHLVEGDFVEVNCATLSGDNALSTLFGHKKGAFTGAGNDRAGLLKVADHGILFLDEIGELGLDEQARLLRALEEKRFFPLGSDKEVASDFHLIAGTNCDLAQAVASGKFRSDLYARINLWSFKLPGLAQRPEDIEPNIDYELDRASALLRGRVSFNNLARQAYMDYAKTAPWPGNFRDLASSMTRMATLADGGRIMAADVTDEIERLNCTYAIAQTVTNNQRDLVGLVLGDMTLDLLDRVQLETVLGVVRQTNSMAEAGRQLFAKSRQEKKSSNDSDRVRKYLDKWNLDYVSVKRMLAGGGH